MLKEKVGRRKFLKLAGLGALSLTMPNYSFAREDKRKEFVENARKYLGTEWVWDGRLTDKNPGLDCMGLIFRAYSETYKKPWTNLSTMPSELIKYEQLGKPAEGLDGILASDLDISKFEEGDIIHLLSKFDTGDEPLKVNEEKYWTRHMGIYSNKKENLFLQAEPRRKVVESDFKKILYENEAIFATRFS